MAEMRDTMVLQWADWLGDRMTQADSVPRLTVERELRLLIDVLTEMVGPMRRDVKKIWYATCEHYGRVAATRGLAAGEVVEEMQFLREMLIRNLSPVLAAMRARQGMATMLRLNRVLDKGIAVAVVGYTDALVATLFAQNGVPSSETELDPGEIDKQLEALQTELASTTGRSGNVRSRPVGTETAIPTEQP
jgi:hypothetical protein